MMQDRIAEADSIYGILTLLAFGDEDSLMWKDRTELEPNKQRRLSTIVAGLITHKLQNARIVQRTRSLRQGSKDGTTGPQQVVFGGFGLTRGNGFIVKGSVRGSRVRSGQVDGRSHGRIDVLQGEKTRDQRGIGAVRQIRIVGMHHLTLGAGIGNQTGQLV